MEYTKLGHIAKIQTGPFGSQLHQSDYKPSGIPCIMPCNIGSNLDIICDNIAYISEEDLNRLAKHKTQEGDIVYSRRGDIEKCAYISSKESGWLCGTGCLKVSIDNTVAIPKFIAYLLSTPDSKAWLVGNAVGTTMLNLNTTVLSDFPISLPDIETQQKVVDIIDAVADKIELNKQINDNLEQQTKALYKSWFVDFEPFKDGDFVESELGLIPEGWKVAELSTVTKQITEKVKDRTDVKVLSPVNTGELVLSEEYFTKQVFSESVSKYIVVKPLQFAYNPARVNIGSLGMNTFTFDGCVSPVYVVFECESNYHHFFDYYRKTDGFKEEVLTRAIGGVRQTLSYKDFSLIKLVYPPQEVVEKFNSIYGKLLDNINSIKSENTKLSDLRDTLLPKLMSGELKINEIDC